MAKRDVEIFDRNGRFIRTEQVDVPDEAIVADELSGKTHQALLLNLQYLALANPTAAQQRQQIAFLTRQVSALIRLQLGLLDDTEGT